MIEMIMYFGMGFFLASLGMLVVAPLVHGRAVRLTTRRLEGKIPSSMAEILADKDLLRAEFSMSTRRLETNVEQLRTKISEQLAVLGRKGDIINRLKVELSALRDQMRATEKEFPVNAAVVSEAKRALAEKESQLSKRTQELAEQSSLADSQKLEVMALNTELKTLKGQLDGASNKLRAVEHSRDAAVREAEQALAEKRSELAKRTQELAELKDRLENLSNDLKAVKDHRDAECIELKVTTQKLMEERTKFDNFHRRAAELVQRLVAQGPEHKVLVRRAEQLEKHLIVQSRLLNERESELEYLRREVEIARKVEADLRVAMIEIDGRQNIAMRNLEADKTKLQAALDRANGERMRLTYALANTKRQVGETWAEQHNENPILTDVAVGYG